MRRRRKLRNLFILPPVILAALFIWLLAGQRANARAGDAAVLALEKKRAALNEREYKRKGTINISSDDEGAKAESQTEGAVGKTEAKEAVSLLFAGDIYFSDHVLNAYDRAGGIDGILDDSLRQAIADADLFMANEEFPFSNRGKAAEDKQYTFRVSPDRISIMQEIGADIVALANNHALDYGGEALLDTCRILDQAGIRRVGAGANLEEAKKLEILEAGGKKIGYLAASRVIPVSDWAAGRNHPGMLTTYDPAILVKEIESARAACDYLVVYVHWGIEKNTSPEEYQRALGRQYIDAGADLVVGSHPHVLQGIEYYKGKPIVYSLGNFIFGSSIPKTALLKAELSMSSGELLRLSLIPAVSSGGYTRRMDSAGEQGLFQYIEELSFDVSVDSEGTVSPKAAHSP